MIRWTGIVEELGLHRFGLRYLDCDPWGFLPDRRRARRRHHLSGRPGPHLRVDRGGVRSRQKPRPTGISSRDWTQRTEPMIEAFNGPPTPGRIGRAAWRPVST